MPDSLKFRYCELIFAAAFAFLFAVFPLQAAQPGKDAATTDIGNGFKPAQRNLTQIFIQIADSLERNGTPEPYLRHVAKEHRRIEALYLEKTGTAAGSFRPAYMTDDYIDRLAANWKILDPKLGLAALSRQIGTLMRESFAEQKGAVAATIDRHQKRVLEFMAGRAAQPAAFEEFQAELLAGSEPTAAARGGNPVDKSQEAARSIRELTFRLFAKLDKALPEKDAVAVKSALSSIFTDVGRMAVSELQIATVEWAISAEAAKDAYEVAREVALSQREKDALSALLQKERFAKSDFPALERFYADAYDKLSERGKQELSKRVWAGMRNQK